MEFDIDNDPDYELKKIDFKKDGDDNLYYNLNKIKEIEYIITKKSLEAVEKYSKSHVIKNPFEETYMRYIIKIYDDEKQIIFASKNSLWNTVRTMILMYLKPSTNIKNRSILFQFANVVNIKCKLIAIVILNKKNNVKKQIEKINAAFRKNTRKNNKDKKEVENLTKITSKTTTKSDDSTIYSDSDDESDKKTKIIPKKPTKKTTDKVIKKPSTKDSKKDSKKVARTDTLDKTKTTSKMSDVKNKHKILSNTISLFIKNNLIRHKDDFVPIAKILSRFKESAELKASKLSTTDINRNKFYAWISKYKWYNDNYREKYKNIRSVLLNYSLKE